MLHRCHQCATSQKSAEGLSAYVANCPSDELMSKKAGITIVTWFESRAKSSMLEDVCICNYGVFKVPTSRSTTSSSNNHTTIISIKLICFNNWIDLSNI